MRDASPASALLGRLALGLGGLDDLGVELPLDLERPRPLPLDLGLGLGDVRGHLSFASAIIAARFVCASGMRFLYCWRAISRSASICASSRPCVFVAFCTAASACAWASAMAAPWRTTEPRMRPIEFR